jgi:hypothetical protein
MCKALCLIFSTTKQNSTDICSLPLPNIIIYVIKFQDTADKMPNSLDSSSDFWGFWQYWT